MLAKISDQPDGKMSAAKLLLLKSQLNNYK